MHDHQLRGEPGAAKATVEPLSSVGKHTLAEHEPAAAGPRRPARGTLNLGLPGEPGQASSPYTVRRGDTLWGISRSHGVPLRSVIAANPQIPNPDHIYPGDRVNLPGGHAPTPATPSPHGTPGHEAPQGGVPPGGTGGTGSATAFLARCEAQVGDRYIFGAETNLHDPNPSVFDCSELVEWGCAQVGVPFVDGSSAQFAAVQHAGRAISVDEARHTPGALLHRDGHVAVSAGTGNETVEARGRAYGVMRYVIGNRFTGAGLIPGLDYNRSR